ncbi:MAG TPA: hypothetical protein VLU24_05795, partial [Mycobacterium sp.]|nr:hypothetical protein [Mycobacterium sp.]
AHDRRCGVVGGFGVSAVHHHDAAATGPFSSETALPIPRLPPTTTAARPASRCSSVTAASVTRCARMGVEL